MLYLKNRYRILAQNDMLCQNLCTFDVEFTDAVNAIRKVKIVVNKTYRNLKKNVTIKDYP